MSTGIEVLLITAVVFGTVIALFGAVYAWEKRVKGTTLEKRIDGFFDRLSDRFDR